VFSKGNKLFSSHSINVFGLFQENGHLTGKFPDMKLKEILSQNLVG